MRARLWRWKYKRRALLIEAFARGAGWDNAVLWATRRGWVKSYDASDPDTVHLVLADSPPTSVQLLRRARARLRKEATT